MPGDLDHLTWTRLDLEPQSRPRPPHGPQPPLRLDPEAHARRLSQEANAAFADAGARRRAAGVDPARLLVLRTRFIGPDQHDHLARLGVKVVAERIERRPLPQPLHEVVAHFQADHVRDAFLAHADRAGLGITAVEEVRGAGGVPDPLRLGVRFADVNRAKAFAQPGHADCPFPFQAPEKPVKIADATEHVLTVQFPDRAAQNRFMAELAARPTAGRAGAALSAGQRASLFDGLERLEQPTPQDRMGYRLRQEGAPEEQEFYLDVDLWHPGAAAELPVAVEQFRTYVTANGGRLTSRVTPLLNTLLIARVRGGAATLDALLHYDRVSRVDFPPRLGEVRFTVLDGEPEMADPVTIPDQGPLACLVDSGVVSGHPLLRGLVVEERDFDSGENTVTDQVGHGTHLAGFIVYGDTNARLQSGEPWRPLVRLLSAKVLRRKEEGFDGEVVRPGFHDLKRAEEQLQEAITAFAGRDRRCRVFNVSIGNPDIRLDHGHQLPWALLLDMLARQLDIVIVVAAGNAHPEALPAPSREAMQEGVRERLFTADHALIDPASAAIALTVGAVCRRETPHDPAGDPGAAADLVASPRDCPAPFTRTGIVADSGAGPSRAVKPELVAYGGNYCLHPHGAGWRTNDLALAEPSLNYRFTERAALSVACGTSVSAPYVAHVCALVEHRLRELYGPRHFHANLIRALVVNSASIPAAGGAWVRRGRTDSEGERRELRSLGYGLPDPYRACYSEDNRAVLLAEDELAERHFHLYRFELPPDFFTRRGVRCLRSTLAFDPPVRGGRQEYLSRTLTMQVFRGASTQVIQEAAAKAEGDAATVGQLLARHKRIRPTLYEWSTVQSAVLRGDLRSFECGDDPAEVRREWHVLVGCKHKFPTEETAARQPYALVVSVEHEDERVQLYQPLRQQIEQQVRVRPTIAP